MKDLEKSWGTLKIDTGNTEAECTLVAGEGDGAGEERVKRGGSAELLSEKAAVECRQQGNPDTHQGVLLGPWGPLWAPGVRPLQMPEQPLNGGDREADR